MEEAEVERMELLEAWAVEAEVELEERLVEAEVDSFSEFLKLGTVLDVCITPIISLIP